MRAAFQVVIAHESVTTAARPTIPCKNSPLQAEHHCVASRRRPPGRPCAPGHHGRPRRPVRRAVVERALAIARLASRRIRTHSHGHRLHRPRECPRGCV